MDEPRRSVVREHEFEEQLSAIIVDAEEADGFVAGAENLLSRDPEIGSAIGDAFGSCRWRSSVTLKFRSTTPSTRNG